MKMKVLFLDIDNCLNHQEFYKNRCNDKIIQELPYPLNEFDPICVNIVNDILDITEAKLVLSSDWRFTNGIENIFDKVGFKHKIYDKTPYGMGKKRGYEIKEWLDNCNELITNYCIIDDLEPYWFLEEQLYHFIHINGNVGITNEDKNKVIEILNKNF